MGVPGGYPSNVRQLVLDGKTNLEIRKNDA